MLRFIILVVLVLCAVHVKSFFRPKEKDYPLRAGDDPGEPLFLTPLIEAGEIDKARKLSKVRPKIGGYVSYSGLFTVNKDCDSNLFFWFFPSLTGLKNSQTLLWLQGGPGATDMYGLFTELGPLVATKKGMKRRKYTWNVKHNLLFIDQPVGTGYSFTNNDTCYPQNETAVGKDLYSAIVQFFKLFPEIQANDFFISGESYAGKYVPALGYAIYKNNPTAEININLAGMLIGDGWSDPISQSNYGDYLYQLGFLDLTQRNRFIKEQNNFIKLVKEKKWQEANEVMDALISGDAASTLFYNYTGYTNLYDYVHGDYEPDYWSEFIQSAKTRKSLHVGSLKFYWGDATFHNLYLDIVQSVKPWVETLLENYRILFYNGQFDIICAYPMEEDFLKSLKWSGAEEYKKADRFPWYVGKELAGFFRGANDLRLMDLLVRNTGHMVPAGQPKWALDMMHKFTANEPFHTEPSTEEVNLGA